MLNKITYLLTYLLTYHEQASSEESYYQSFGKYWLLNQNNQKTEHLQTQSNVNKKCGPDEQQ